MIFVTFFELRAKWHLAISCKSLSIFPCKKTYILEKIVLVGSTLSVAYILRKDQGATCELPAENECWTWNKGFAQKLRPKSAFIPENAKFVRKTSRWTSLCSPSIVPGFCKPRRWRHSENWSVYGWNDLGTILGMLKDGRKVEDEDDFSSIAIGLDWLLIASALYLMMK